MVQTLHDLFAHYIKYRVNKKQKLPLSNYILIVHIF